MIKKWKRGFDQAEEMAKLIGKELSVPVIRALKRRKWTVPQSDIKDNDFRELNIKGCFGLTKRSKAISKGSIIIIFDDIVTSGATMKEAGRIIRSLRPSKIFLVSVASR
jgi:predicted amidophosphoribosyltransferase